MVLHTFSDLRQYPYRFGLRVVRIMPHLLQDVKDASAAAAPEPIRVWDPVKAFEEWEFNDPWVDARLEEVYIYLRGNKSLRVPEEWKHLF